jgi:hypothetical protein
VSFRRRPHPRAGLRVVGHPPAEPPPVPEAEAPEAPEPAPPALEPALVATAEPPPALRQSQIDLLEELTARWMKQARIAGAGPDATMFYAAPPPPPPPPREPAADVPDEVPPTEAEADQAADEAWSGVSDAPPRVVRDWASRHDPRSRDFDVRSRLRAVVPLQSFVRETGPVLDQGSVPPLSLRDASGCVGMACAAAANVLALAGASAYARPADVALLGKGDALALYDRAQDLDSISGKAYPGTSVLAGMLAGREAGLWPGFLWAFGLRDIAQALLQVGPVVIGVPWDEGLESPGPDGVAAPGGQSLGGHALALVGLRMAVAGRPGPFFVAQQSRGPAEGDGGRIYLHHKTLAGLLAGVGEAAIPIPPWGLAA